MKGRLVVTVLLLVLSAQTDIITTEVTISNNLTLASSVTYTVKLSMNTLINSGSTLQLWFSTFFNITTNTLNNCQATISSVVPLSSAACYATNSSTLYYINFDSLFPVTATITDITLSVRSGSCSSSSTIQLAVAPNPSTFTSFRRGRHWPTETPSSATTRRRWETASLPATRTLSESPLSSPLRLCPLK